MPYRKPSTTAASPGRRAWLAGTIAAAAVVIVVAAGLVAALAWGNRSRTGRAARVGMADDMRNNADLLELKSEAESLAIEGRLAEAHGKYRQLQQLAVGRDIKDPLFWDIMERAKVDQDKIYTMLLNQMAPAVPPPRPGEVDADGFATDAYAARAGAGRGPQAREDAPAASAKGDAGVGGPAAADEAGRSGEAQEPAGPTAVAPAPSVPSTRPAPAPAHAPAPETASETATAVQPTYGVTDAQIGDALKRGVDFLIPHFEKGQLARDEGTSAAKHAGLNALCVYALLTAGQAMKDPRLDVRGEFMKELLSTMKGHDLHPVPGDPQQPITYARSLRAAALAVYNRPEDASALKEDVNWLVAASVSGAYTYDDQFTRGSENAARFESPDDGPRADGGMGGPPMFLDEDHGLAARATFDEDDGSTEVIPVHGVHDPRTGRELGPVRTRPGFGWMPRDSRTPLPRAYPQRTPVPRGRPLQTTQAPPGGYGRGWAPMPEPLAPPVPGRQQQESASVRFPWDNSNSQYGLLGVWSGAEVGVEVPARYWKDVERHWMSCQLKTGEWGYKEGDHAGALAMTCGGLASLFVTHDWLAAPMVKGSVGREPLTAPLAAGLAWLERENNCLDTPNPKTHFVGYDLYGLERVGLASGYKYFGGHDWYRELATKMVGSQWETGAWGRKQDGQDALIDTAYTVLFLARGRHPILMNKLKFDRSEVVLVDDKPAPGYWANRPRDLANLTRFAGRQLERGLNWQVVGLDVEWHDWLDSPVLYIASHQAPGLADADYEKLRQFVAAGGLLFTHADTGAGAFNRWVAETLAVKVCGAEAKLEDLPEDHLLYNVHYRIRSPKPRLQVVSNGSRLLLVHSPTDLATVWQQRGERVSADTFRIGINLFLYASGKVDLRNRLSSPYVPEPTGDPEGRVQVARLKYAGPWDPEPGAWPRFRRQFEWATGVAVEHPPVELKDLKFGLPEVDSGGDSDPAGLSGSPAGGPAVLFAHLTGNAAHAFTDAEVATVKSFVESGGTLVIDACGGSPGFYESVRDGLLTRAFPGAKPQPLPAGHALLRGADVDERLSLKPRAYVTEAMPGRWTELAVLRAGAGQVVLSPLDLTTGLLGTNTWGIAGYEPAACSQFMANALRWAHDGAP